LQASSPAAGLRQRQPGAADQEPHQPTRHGDVFEIHDPIFVA
jgi:hypothetical protein